MRRLCRTSLARDSARTGPPGRLTPPRLPESALARRSLTRASHGSVIGHLRAGSTGDLCSELFEPRRRSFACWCLLRVARAVQGEPLSIPDEDLVAVGHDAQPTVSSFPRLMSPVKPSTPDHRPLRTAPTPRSGSLRERSRPPGACRSIAPVHGARSHPRARSPGDRLLLDTGNDSVGTISRLCRARLRRPRSDRRDQRTTMGSHPVPGALRPRAPRPQRRHRRPSSRS